jgi:hypothetical protein
MLFYILFIFIIFIIDFVTIKFNTMKIFILLFVSVLLFANCEKFKIENPDDTTNTTNTTNPEMKENVRKVTFVRDCTGSYIRMDAKDYKICNYQDVQNFESGDVLKVSYDSIGKCENSNPEQLTCKMAHLFEHNVHINKSELLYRPNKEITITQQKMKVVKDCSGTYIQYENADYQVCNKDLLVKYNDGDWILASFYTLSECPEKGDVMVCMLYHENKGWVKVFGIQ